MLVAQGSILLATAVIATEALGTNSSANHIFNAIHSSMRQWGSSLNHNGMSFFVSTVPAGTEFYHGTTSPTRINGTQWLAFEPEHALIFARPHGRPPPKDDEPRAPPFDNPNDEGYDVPPQPILWHGHPILPWQRIHPPRRPAPPPQQPIAPSPASPADQQQQPLLAPPPSHPDRPDRAGPGPGYLHTYHTLHALHLLYLDGQSAAKSTLGTLDTQDLILRPLLPSPSASPSPSPSSGPMDEAHRAADLCALASTIWQGKIDGFLRMEGGFEVILCDFEKHLRVEKISKVLTRTWGEQGIGYYRAVARRYDGIGGGRVRVDYEGMVSAFGVEGAVGWDGKGRVRVGGDEGVRGEVGRRVGEMVMQRAQGKGEGEGAGEGMGKGVDWQAVVDMVVGRYGGRIESWTSGKARTFEGLKGEIMGMLRPFVDADHRDGGKEVKRCARQFWPATVEREAKDLGTAAKAVKEVSHVVCQELYNAGTAKTYRQAIEILQALRQWLSWTTWKRCRGCSVDEICFLPIWPVGSEQDFEQPQCLDEVPMDEKHNGYWGRPGPPPGKDRPKPPGSPEERRRG
ncbi:hypothetical protein KVT40_003910 [Elsinoe batatas]|uniref:Uncharacterized protein n=1 Tax=Elsinoe batatas TaxID=2601811 RepID=A0A8K0PGZ6_9PEZI|nr:hypothetical protein KVT40_003910 [Elsinoe batatas]